MNPAPPAVARYRSLWRCLTTSPVVETAGPVLLGWVNRNRPGAVPHLDEAGWYRLSARSRAVVVPHSEPDGTRAIQVAVLTDRDDSQWATALSVVDTPGDGAWVHTTLEHTPPGPEDVLLPPQVLRVLMEALQAADGSARLPSSAVRVQHPPQVAGVAEALTDPGRLLPLVVAPAADALGNGPRSLPEGLVPLLRGMASVYILDGSAREEIVPLLPAGIDLRPGRVHVLTPPPFVRASEHDPSAPDVVEQVQAAVTACAQAAAPPEPVAKVLASLDDRTAAVDAHPPDTVRVHTTTTPPAPGPTCQPLEEHPDLSGERERIRLTGQVERLREEVARLADQATRATAQARELDQDNIDLTADRDRQAERARRAEAEVAWLRAQAADEGLHLLATTPAPPLIASGGPPRRVEELLERITRGPDLPHLMFTLDEGPVHDLALDRNKEALWVGRAWEALEALEDWCRYRQDRPTNNAGLHNYLAQAPDGYRVIPPRRVGFTESDTVRNSERLAAQRVFPVPTDVDPTGQAPMFAHIKLDVDYGICPRLHFLRHPADLAVVVGYLGRHLPVGSTN